MLTTHLLYVGCCCATCRVECSVLSTWSQSQLIFVATYVLCSNFCSLISVMLSCTLSTQCEEFAFLLHANWKEKKATFLMKWGRKLSVTPFHQFISKSAFLTFCAWSWNVKFSGAPQQPSSLKHIGLQLILSVSWPWICVSHVPGHYLSQPAPWEQ